jgi:predicted HTH domain antitoxin
MQVALHIPDDVAELIRLVDGQDIARHILEAYAIHAYQTRMLSESQLRRLLGFETRYEFDDFLASHQVPRNYTIEDLQQDRQVARELGL